MKFGMEKREWFGYTRWRNIFEDMFIHFDRIHEPINQSINQSEKYLTCPE